MTTPQAPDLDRMREAAKKATPGDLDTIPKPNSEYGGYDSGHYECPACGGCGEVKGEIFTNFDGVALGVQFFGIGNEFKAYEEFFRAANPSAVLYLLDRIAELETQVLDAALSDRLDEAGSPLTWQERARAAEARLEEFERIKRMAATGTAENFLACDDETKRLMFAIGVEESSRRKEAEARASTLQAELERASNRSGGGLGWLYVGDDGIEWSANHPVRSGEMPDARMIRRATNRELLSALKDAWEAHGEAVESEGRLRQRWTEAEARARALQGEVDGLREEVAFAWLVEAPGARYLSVRRMGIDEFFWTTDANRALRFVSKEQADLTMMAVREMRPDLFGFALTLGDAQAVEHKWVAALSQDQGGR